MTKYGQIGWRMAAVAAFVGTAALAVILSRAPIGSSAGLSSDITGPACATSGLDAWLGLGAGLHAADRTYYTLEFTNVSNHPCSLEGYPEVSVYAGNPVPGGQIGSAASRDTSVRPQPVMLEPGATAHSVLQVVTASAARLSGCAQVTAEELRVMLPRVGRPAFVPVHIPLCADKGRVSLRVQAIQARAGIPGHSIVP